MAVVYISSFTHFQAFIKGPCRPSPAEDTLVVVKQLELLAEDVEGEAEVCGPSAALRGYQELLNRELDI
ncbi:unnamed protein product [Merluccius merluccius]